MPERIENISKVNLRVSRNDVWFGDVIYSPGGTYGPRVQRDYQIVIVHYGDLQLTLDDEIIAVPAGRAILLHPRHREFFCFSSETPTRHSWCAIRPLKVPRALSTLIQRVQGTIVWTPRLQQLFDIGQACGQSPCAHPDLEGHRFLHLALHLFTEFAIENRRQSESVVDQRLEKMQHFIARESQSPLTLADLAREAGLSKQHLLKVCRQRGLASPLRQLYQHRLETAADLLLRTGLSVKEISERCGFENPFHFSRKFREWSQIPPRAYRERIHR